MFDRRVVQVALKHSWISDNNPGRKSKNHGHDHDSIISLLVHDIFGGEILKTHNKKGWHFYNRINDKRFDFTRSETANSSGAKRFEDIPSTPDETYNYFAKEDYSAFFIKFIRAFEEAVGLEKYQPLLS
jgi:hypothetical protein